MRHGKVLSCGVSAFAIGMAGCATSTEAPPFDPKQIQASERALAQLDEAQHLRQMPTTQEDPLGGPGDVEAGTTRPSDETGGSNAGPNLGNQTEPVISLSLQQCIQRAVLYNHQVKVDGYQPAIDASRVTEAEALFDPVLFANLQLQRKDDMTGGSSFTNPVSLTTGTAFFNKVDTYEGQVGVKDNLTSGGQLQFDFDTTYNDQLPQQFIENPFYTNKVELQLTQPLLRDFGSDVNQARIFIGRDQARTSMLEFRKSLEKQLQQVEETYWQLVQAIRDVAAEESVLTEDQKLYQLQYSRLKQRLVSAEEVSQVQTSLDERTATLISFKTNARNLSDQLKQLMNDPNLPISDPSLIVPSDLPVDQPEQFDVDDQINTGMENRFELGEKLLAIDQATVTYGVARNNTLPKLDFVGSATPNATEGDYTATLSQESKFGHFEYSFGLQFELPIGNREALAILRRTGLQRLQAIESYKEQISTVVLDVRVAARNVESAYDQIVRFRQARLAAERALYDEINREEEGTEAFTPDIIFFRLGLADRLAAAKEEEDKAVASYNIALEELEFAKGTLLKYNNVVMQEEPYGNEGLLR